MLTRWSNWNELFGRDMNMEDTFRAMDEFRRRMNRVFEEMVGEGEPGMLAEPWTGGWLRCNLYDMGSELVVKADVPGLSKEDLELSVSQSSLTIKGERTDEIPEGYSVHRMERGPVSFSRSFTLPAEVDTEKTSANIKDGVLTVHLEKTKESRPKQISVKAG